MVAGRVRDQKVAGSNPAAPTIPHTAVAVFVMASHSPVNESRVRNDPEELATKGRIKIALGS